MAVLYVRVSDDIIYWLRRESERSGVSMAKVVEAFLTTARERNWEIGGPPKVPVVRNG